ncbi:hypothetical protein E4U13_006569 [Claviceps humidiphila]|uniref:F-box domain-containing protein n=1 Tax=Claviceps humidiphila TaxID=1294629 RepID=A0A9P7TQI4_9HYPO|nr:hypothetical protein E4U13_006569 [Claviceps humidiphila]
MLSLLWLPPEIVLSIFRLLGSAFFRRDVRRLLVSKWWYELAWPVFYQDLRFRAGSLERFILASKSVDLLHSIRKNVRTVKLVLNGFEGWHSIPSASNASGSIEINLQVVDSWTSKVNGNVAALTGILQHCTGLRRLKVEARPETHPLQLNLQRRDYLAALPLASLSSLSQLTCLEIDTAGTHLMHDNDAPKVHLCSKISTMLPTLRRFRCRMSCICPTIFDVPAGSLPLALEDFIVNLSLSDIRGSDTSYRYPSRCEALPGDGSRRLKADMESCAKKLVPLMKSPRIVRVLSHTFPGMKLHSLDILTGRRMELKPNAPWDADEKKAILDEPSVLTPDVSDSGSSSDESSW